MRVCLKIHDKAEIPKLFLCLQFVTPFNDNVSLASGKLCK